VVGSPGIPNRIEVMWDRGDVAGGGGDRQHAEEKGERLDRRHLEHERQHEGERRRAAEPGQEAHHEAERHAEQHETERRPREDLDEPGDAGVQKVQLAGMLSRERLTGRRGPVT
jgi:hypothetical protein